MTLRKGRIGQTYAVESIELNEKTKRRLEILGLTESALITVLNNRRNGSVIFKVRGTRYAIGRQIAEGIEIGGRFYGKDH